MHSKKKIPKCFIINSLAQINKSYLWLRPSENRSSLSGFKFLELLDQRSRIKRLKIRLKKLQVRAVSTCRNVFKQNFWIPTHRFYGFPEIGRKVPRSTEPPGPARSSCLPDFFHYNAGRCWLILIYRPSIETKRSDNRLIDVTYWLNSSLAIWAFRKNRGKKRNIR